MRADEKEIQGRESKGPHAGCEDPLLRLLVAGPGAAEHLPSRHAIARRERVDGGDTRNIDGVQLRESVPCVALANHWQGADADAIWPHDGQPGSIP